MDLLPRLLTAWFLILLINPSTKVVLSGGFPKGFIPCPFLPPSMLNIHYQQTENGKVQVQTCYVQDRKHLYVTLLNKGYIIVGES